MVMAIILFMGKVSGAHLNPAVSLAFAARGDFPWRRVPGYIVVQLLGRPWRRCSSKPSSTCRPRSARTTRRSGYSAGAAFWMELILTLGLVSVILGTASGAQNLGIIGAFGVGGYIALAGSVGQPDLGDLDEPGPHLRARSRRRGASRTTGSTSPGRSPAPRSRSGARSCCAARAAARPARARPRGTSSPRSPSPDKVPDPTLVNCARIAASPVYRPVAR